MKTFTSDHPSDDKIIAITKDTIYKINPKPKNMEAALLGLAAGNLPEQNSIGIPFSYIKEINLEEGKSFIEILFGADSSEQLAIHDSAKKMEIFQFLKNEIPSADYSLSTHSKIKAGKKPLLGMVVLAGIFTWAMYLALEMEKGYEYEVVGSARSVGGIVVAIASLGMKNLILIFSVLFSIAMTSFFLKTRKPKVVHTIIANH